jgi:hypothetical protein
MRPQMELMESFRPCMRMRASATQPEGPERRMTAGVGGPGRDDGKGGSQSSMTAGNCRLAMQDR